MRDLALGLLLLAAFVLLLAWLPAFPPQ